MNIKYLREIGEMRTSGNWRLSGHSNIIQTDHITRDVWHIANCHHNAKADAHFIATAARHWEALLSIAEGAKELLYACHLTNVEKDWSTSPAEEDLHKALQRLEEIT